MLFLLIFSKDQAETENKDEKHQEKKKIIKKFQAIKNINYYYRPAYLRRRFKTRTPRPEKYIAFKKEVKKEEKQKFARNLAKIKFYGKINNLTPRIKVIRNANAIYAIKFRLERIEEITKQRRRKKKKIKRTLLGRKLRRRAKLRKEKEDNRIYYRRRRRTNLNKKGLKKTRVRCFPRNEKDPFLGITNYKILILKILYKLALYRAETRDPEVLKKWIKSALNTFNSYHLNTIMRCREYKDPKMDENLYRRSRRRKVRNNRTNFKRANCKHFSNKRAN